MGQSGMTGLTLWLLGQIGQGGPHGHIAGAKTEFWTSKVPHRCLDSPGAWTQPEYVVHTCWRTRDTSLSLCPSSSQKRSERAKESLEKQDSWVQLMVQLNGQTVHCTAKPMWSISKHPLMLGSMPCCKVLGLALHLMSQPQRTVLTL